MESLQPRFGKSIHGMRSITIEEASRTTTSTTWSITQGRMLTHPKRVNHIGIGFQRDAPCLLPAASLCRCRRWSEDSTINPHDGPQWTGLGAENGKPIGSFYVTGSIEEPSTHEMVWYPEFEDDFRPATD